MPKKPAYSLPNNLDLVVGPSFIELLILDWNYFEHNLGFSDSQESQVWCAQLHTAKKSQILSSSSQRSMVCPRLFNDSLNGHLLLSPQTVDTILANSQRTKRNLCNQPAPYWYPGWERSTYPLSKGRVKDEFPFGIPRWDIMIPKRIWTTQETSQNLHLQTYQNQKAFFWISTAQLGCLNSLFMNFCGSLLTNFVRSAIYQCFYISFLHPYTNMIKHVDLILGLAQVPKHISFKSNFEKQKRPPKKGMFWEIVV